MEDDKKASSFSDALYTYLWFTENFISESRAAETVGEMSEFIAEVAKAVVVLSALTVPTFTESMENYFAKHGLSRESVFTFLASYCFEYHAENEDIFSVILNTCTFVYRIVIYCQHRGLLEYIDFASMCWTEIFNYDLSEEFYSEGGWEELERYVNDNCYVPKSKDTDQKAFMSFLDEINYLFPKLKMSDEDEYTASLTDSVVEEMNAVLEKAKLFEEESADPNVCQNSVHFVSTSICEANITAEEAVSAYELLTGFYGQSCAKLNCEHTNDNTMHPNLIDMEHVYKTLTNFINEGILEIEASTGKIIQPNIRHNANIRKATLCCTNCQHEEQVTIISSDSTRPRIYPSLVTELIHDENVCRLESDEQLDTK